MEMLMNSTEVKKTSLRQALRILVVDDESDFATSMAFLLKKKGYDAHTCLVSKQCLETIDRLRPQVVLLDLAMPGMSGLDLAPLILENPTTRPMCLVAVTGRGENLDRVQTTLCGFDHHLVKPLDFSKLDAILLSVQQQFE